MPNPDIIVLQDNRHDTGWVTCIIEGRWVQAKVYDEPSTYGVFDGRVSKLSIGKTSERREFENFFDQMAYHYDRGLDFNRLGKGGKALLRRIVDELEKLPKVFA